MVYLVYLDVQISIECVVDVIDLIRHWFNGVFEARDGFAWLKLANSFQKTKLERAPYLCKACIIKAIELTCMFSMLLSDSMFPPSAVHQIVL